MPSLPSFGGTFFSFPRVCLCPRSPFFLGFYRPYSPGKILLSKAQFAKHHSPAQKPSERPSMCLVRPLCLLFQGFLSGRLSPPTLQPQHLHSGAPGAGTSAEIFSPLLRRGGGLGGPRGLERAAPWDLLLLP